MFLLPLEKVYYWCHLLLERFHYRSGGDRYFFRPGCNTPPHLDQRVAGGFEVRHSLLEQPDHEVADRFQSLLRLVLQDRHPVTERHGIVGGVEDRLLRGVECIDEVGKVQVPIPDRGGHFGRCTVTEEFRRDRDSFQFRAGTFDLVREHIPRLDWIVDTHAREAGDRLFHAGKGRLGVDTFFLKFTEQCRGCFEVVP